MDIPNEILENILGYLSLSNDINNALSVCKLWNEMIPLAVTHIEFKNKNKEIGSENLIKFNRLLYIDFTVRLNNNYNNSIFRIRNLKIIFNSKTDISKWVSYWIFTNPTEFKYINHVAFFGKTPIFNIDRYSLDINSFTYKNHDNLVKYLSKYHPIKLNELPEFRKKLND